MKKPIILGLALALLLLLLSLLFPTDTAYRLFFGIVIPIWMGVSLQSTVKSAKAQAKKEHYDRLQLILSLSPPLLLILVLGFTLFAHHAIGYQESLSPDILIGLVGGALFLALVFRAAADIRQRRRFPKQEETGEEETKDD